MNFWTPTFASWSDGLNTQDMPWSLDIDYIETFIYDPSSKKFIEYWRDDFDYLD